MPKLALRSWQEDAYRRWQEAGHRGIISVVTGGGKTIFALSCIDRIQPVASLVIVPTAALLDQWWEEAANYFDLELDEINIITRKQGLKLGAINLAVINTAAKIADRVSSSACFLIVDECHRAASEHFRAALKIKTCASLGLSATPDRPYDEGLQDVLVPALGPVIYKYDYADALRDRVIVPFSLTNVVFELEEDRQREYERLTATIARAIRRHGVDARETVALFLKRARVVNLSLNRVRLTLRLIALNKAKRILVFHEDIQACELINQILTENGVSSGVYHSKMGLKDRALTLGRYRRGEIRVLVTCRALDEGFNVPETQLGIIAASTATRRQRIQRLGRIVRPAEGKDGATIYTLVATNPEISRLKHEEEDLEGVALVRWSRA